MPLNKRDEIALVESLNVTEKRIRGAMIQVKIEVWPDLWGESIPDDDEYSDVIIDRVYDTLSPFDRESLRCMSQSRKRSIALSTI